MIKVLLFLNLLDAQRRLSITNLGLMALIIKTVVSPSADWSSIVAMVVAFANYMHKRDVISRNFNGN